MVIRQTRNYKIDINKSTSDILVESANPDLDIDQLEAETLKDSLINTAIFINSNLKGYIYFPITESIEYLISIISTINNFHR